LIKCIEELIKMYQTRILLRVNKKKIPLKSFVEDILIYPLLGFVKALKGALKKLMS